MSPHGINHQLFYINREPHIYPGAHPFPVTYGNPQQSAVNPVSYAVYTKTTPIVGAGNNLHKAQPCNTSGDHVSPQHAYAVDEG